MNKIITEQPSPTFRSPRSGDLYVSQGNFYILFSSGSLCHAVNLATGNTWRGDSLTYDEATAGLTFFRRDATITIQ